jgi:hypothetical protein
MAWAVDFAQTDLDALSSGRLHDLAVELIAFEYWGGKDMLGQHGLGFAYIPGKEDLRIVQEEFCSIFHRCFHSKGFSLGQFEMSLFVIPAVGRVVKHVNSRTTQGHQHAIALLTLAMLFDTYLPLLKECPAPKPRSRKGETCGRWFVGRPNQTYCSPLCQNRATTRSARQKQHRAPQKKKG